MVATIYPVKLTCEYLTDPLGVDEKAPRLGWIIESSGERGQRQTAYHILVASSPAGLEARQGDLWDSGRIESDRSQLVAYEGVPLRRRMGCWWGVRVWDREGQPSAWSRPAYWEMGMLDTLQMNTPDPPPCPWIGKWIAYPVVSTPLFRREFFIKPGVVRARAYICGLGYYELYLNGHKVGDQVLDPPQTDYDQRAFYATLDIAPDLRLGPNAVGIMLGTGWYDQDLVWKPENYSYGKPGVLCELHIDYEDGSTEIIATDGFWRASGGPLLNNNVYAGEEYDARLEMEGWDQAGFDDRQWGRAQWIGARSPLLVGRPLEPIRIIRTIRPQKLSQPQPGVYVFDLGENIAGWARIHVSAPTGTTLRLRFAESLDSSGMIDTKSTGDWATRVVQTDVYVCKGTGIEVWEPRFTYHGFQYVELSGYPTEPTPDMLEGVVVHSDVARAGKFESSDPYLNKLQEIAVRTQLGNLHGVPTDCPHRERCGWLGDAHLFTEMTLYNFEMAAFWSNFLANIETTRRGGITTNIAPGKRLCGGNADFQVAIILIPWYLYRHYGDQRILERHYAGMVTLLDHFRAVSKDHILATALGDWCEPFNAFPQLTSVEFSSTVIYYQAAATLGRVARVLGKTAEADAYQRLSAEIRQAMIDRFFDAGRKTYGSQGADTLALYLHLAPENTEEAVLKSLLGDIQEKGYVTSGIFGSRYLYWILGRLGHGQLALDLLKSTKEPGIGHILAHGATTFWEQFTYPPRVIEFGEYTKNHPMRGAFTAWFYNAIGGIEPDEERPGFKHFFLRPQWPGDLRSAQVEFVSPYGRIVSNWQKTEGGLAWQFIIPANTTATVYVPSNSADAVREQGRPVTESAHVQLLRQEAGACVFEAQAGAYEWIVAQAVVDPASIAPRAGAIRQS